LKDFSNADKDYYKAMQLAPKDAQMRTDHAIHLYRQKKIAQAIAECSTAIAIEPKCSMAYFFRGMFYEESKNAVNAMKDFDKAIELSPTYRAPYWRRALLRLRQGNKNGARKDWQELLKLDPHFKDETGKFCKIASANFNFATTHSGISSPKIVITASNLPTLSVITSTSMQLAAHQLD
jgi:tetratricopeptide (TPR) repeat protein